MIYLRCYGKNKETDATKYYLTPIHEFSDEEGTDTGFAFTLDELRLLIKSGEVCVVNLELSKNDEIITVEECNLPKFDEILKDEDAKFCSSTRKKLVKAFRDLFKPLTKRGMVRLSLNENILFLYNVTSNSNTVLALFYDRTVRLNTPYGKRHWSYASFEDEDIDYFIFKLYKSTFDSVIKE